MSGDDHRKWGTAGPIAAEEEGEGRFESSVNAVSFGLVATAVLISIFLLLALFERFMFVRPTPSPPLDAKLPPFASPKVDHTSSSLFAFTFLSTFLVLVHFYLTVFTLK